VHRVWDPSFCLKDVDRAPMKRFVITAVLKLAGEAVLITLLVGIIIAVLGNLNQWETSARYSNAFFIAGGLVFIGGAFSRKAAGEEWGTYMRINAEGFRDMSPGERAEFIVNASSSLHLVIVGVLSGSLLMLISLLVWTIG
jgi:hypothetical protein